MKKYENYSLIEKTLSKANIKVKDYKNILSKMMDEKSKYMFFYRTMFDNTGNPKYALKLEKCMYEGDNFLSISDKYMYDFLDFMLRNSNYNKKIYIIGYSPIDDMIWLFFHKREGLNIPIIYDSNVNECFVNTYDKTNILVKPLSSLYIDRFSSDSVFIINSNDFYFIKDDLVSKKNISEDNIFVFNEKPILYRYDQYFSETFIKYSNDEVFIDVGADKLSNTLMFINLVNNKYDYIYAFEPMKKDYNDGLIAIKNNNIDRINYENFGLWNKKDVLKFSSKDFSFLEGDRTEEINVDTIDNYLNGKKATIIKMDIEGSESKAIEGASNTIKENTPVLMICVYHKDNDSINLANQVLNINPNYNIFVRHYTFSIFETVMFFVPKNKVNKICE